MSKTDTNSAPFSYDGLDRVIHEKARLGLLTSLMAHPKGLAFADLNDSTVSSARTFLKTMAQIEFTFNWFYADDHDIAMFSSGRLPKRPRGIDSGLPTVGTGRYEWRGFLSPSTAADSKPAVS